MAFTAETGDHKVTRSDIFLVDPRALVVDWKKNLSRNGEEPPVDDALVELARDMMPKKGQGDAEDGTSGQLNPILTRPLPDRRLEVVGGFRRMRAALWLVESGTCPDFRVKYVVSRLSDAEAALVNLSENLQREDPKPDPVGPRHPVADRGLRHDAQAGRRSPQAVGVWCDNLLNLVMLPTAIQSSVASGQTPVAAALELVKLPDRPAGRRLRRTGPGRREDHGRQGQGEAAGGPRGDRARAARSPGPSSSSGRSSKARPAPPTPATGSPPTCSTTSPGKRSEEAMDKYWDRAFAEPAGTRMTG